MANWGNLSSRGNVEDRRGFGPIAAGGISLTGLVLLIAFNLLTGGSPEDVLNQQQNVQGVEFEGNDSYEEFASRVLGSNNQMWSELFSASGRTYHQPKLVLFRSATNSSCGLASSEVGPHYCPLDRTIYLDETFFEVLTSRFGARGGDVAEAYVIAHEVGHHAQNELGLMSDVDTQEESIKLELQADCFAGLWVNSIKDQNVLEAGEVAEAMDAASAVGDDRIQKRVSGYVNPENWTHGSSSQRVEWFDKGYQSGSLSACSSS